MSDTLLSRLPSLPSSSLTPLQSQVDGLVGGFTEQATDWRSLAAMMAGGMTYRLGRMGAMAAGTGRLASLGIGLGAEVTAFEMTNRSLASLTGDVRSNPNLWRWEGNGGIRQGLLSSLVTFGALKGAGSLAQGENTVVQHLLQDTGMVLGHQISGALGITDRPQGTLAEQFLHAEATNLQLSAGMALAHSFAPGIQGIEQGLDLSLRMTDVGATPRGRPELEGSHMGLPLQNGLQPALAAMGGREPVKGPDMVFMVPGGEKRPSDPSTLTSPGGSDDQSGAEPRPRVDRDAETLVPAEPDSTTVREDQTTPDSVPKAPSPPSVAIHEEDKDHSSGSTTDPTLQIPIAGRPEIPPPAPDTAGSTTTPDPTDKDADAPVPQGHLEQEVVERIALPGPPDEGQRRAVTVALGPVARAQQEAREAQALVEGPAEGDPRPAAEPVAAPGNQDDSPTRVPRMTPSTVWLKDGMLLEGRYKVLEPLGSGGFGVVYKIEDTLMNRIVVVKVPREELDTDVFIPRFENEIKITGSLDPRRVVIVYDMIQLKDQKRILPVMEYVPGDDLSDVLREGKLSVTKRLEIFVKICEGIDSAHRRWFIHRDLKPGNIRITHDGDVKIMDWGLAKYFGKRRRTTDRAPDSEREFEITPALIEGLKDNLTIAGATLGTPGYIAPEVLSRQRREDPRSIDIFALGIILYEMVTGRHPFVDNAKRKNAAERYFSTHPDHIQPPPHFEDLLGKDLPKEIYKLEEICRRALDPDPDKRQVSARELREAVLMAYAQAEFDRIGKLGSEMKTLETAMHEAWGNYRLDRQISPEQEERMLDPLYALKRKRQQRDQAAESLTLYLTRLTNTDPAPEARRMIAELSWMRLIEADDLMDQSVRDTLRERIREFDFPADPDLSSSLRTDDTRPMGHMMEALDGRLSLAIQAAGAVGGKEMDGVGVRAISIEEAEPGYFREGAPFFEGDLQNFVRNIRLSAGYYVLEFSHPHYASFRYPLHVKLAQVRRGIVNRVPLRLDLELLPKELVPPGFVLVPGGEATIGHNIHRFDDPSFVISFPERHIAFGTFAATNLVTVEEYTRFIRDQLAGINSLTERGDFEAAVRLAERVRRWIPRNQPQVASRDLEDNPDWEGLLRSAFEEIRYHWEIKATGEGRDLRFTLTDPTSRLSLRDDPILSNQPIHSIPYEAPEAYADWFYENLQQQGYEGPRPRPPTVTELEILSRNSFPWTFPWGYYFRRTFLSSRLVHKDLLQDTHAHPLGTHPLGPKFYRDYSLYEGRDESGRPIRLVDLLGNVREWTSSATEQNSVHQYGGSPRTPAGSFFLPSARMYFPKDVTDDLHGGFRLVIPYPLPAKPSPK